MSQKANYNGRKTSLVYLERDGKYLILHRTKKEHDENGDKWIGVGGKIVRIPELWPAWSGRRDVFPYSVGEKVDIVSEPYRNLFGVARPGQTYWVRAKELAEAIKRKDERLMDVYMGPDEKYTKYGRVTCWAFNCRMPEVVTNGWARYQPHDSPLDPTSFLIPKDVLGNLTYAGAKTRYPAQFADRLNAIAQ